MPEAMRPEPLRIHEWLEIHRKLMDMESAFTDLALKAVTGEVTQPELEAARALLMHAREQCTAAYESAFPKSSLRKTVN